MITDPDQFICEHLRLYLIWCSYFDWKITIFNLRIFCTIFYSCGFRVIISFVLINTTRCIAPLLRHGCSLYRRDGEDDDAATDVQTINFPSQNLTTVVQFTILFISYFTSSNSPTSITCGGVVVAVISAATAATAAIAFVRPTIVLVRICLFVF